jgi:DNA-binding LacI/PurR family transcriptional regulator
MADHAVEMLDQLTSGRPVAKRNVMLPIRLIDRNSVS